MKISGIDPVHVIYQIPAETVSEANQSNRAHWGHHSRRRNQHKRLGAIFTTQFAKAAIGKSGSRVTITRIGGRKMDPDNLAGAFKALQDGIASALLPGLNAGAADDFFEWSYEQRPNNKRSSAVEVKIEIKGVK